MWEKLLALFKSKGIELGDKEKDLKTEFDKLEKDKDGNVDLSKLDLSKLTNKDVDPVLQAVIEQNKILMQSVKDLQSTLGKEQSDREAAIKAQTDKAKADQLKKVTDAVEKAFKEKRIVEADKAIWTARLTKDFDEWNKELEAKPVPKQFEQKKNETPPGEKPLVTGNKTFDAVVQHGQAAAIEKPFVYESLTK